ncbi:hypothetical protein AC579_8464 [Pseudocercospora musae]|uniref:Uncharacterized protein n=1 Tax=Pseudocercospora musae TaxID=113226 RepID=A0A139I2H9_9PEZI|nr:hypothetical protein AC579_8464 [Pseudocercospora musae]
MSTYGYCHFERGLSMVHAFIARGGIFWSLEYRFRFTRDTSAKAAICSNVSVIVPQKAANKPHVEQHVCKEMCYYIIVPMTLLLLRQSLDFSCLLQQSSRLVFLHGNLLCKALVFVPIFDSLQVTVYHSGVEIFAILRLRSSCIHRQAFLSKCQSRANSFSSIDSKPEVLLHQLHAESALVSFASRRIGTKPWNGVPIITDGRLRSGGMPDIGQHSGIHSAPDTDVQSFGDGDRDQTGAIVVAKLADQAQTGAAACENVASHQTEDALKQWFVHIAFRTADHERQAALFCSDDSARYRRVVEAGLRMALGAGIANRERRGSIDGRAIYEDFLAQARRKNSFAVFEIHSFHMTAFGYHTENQVRPVCYLFATPASVHSFLVLVDQLADVLFNDIEHVEMGIAVHFTDEVLRHGISHQAEPDPADGLWKFLGHCHYFDRYRDACRSVQR